MLRLLEVCCRLVYSGSDSRPCSDSDLVCDFLDHHVVRRAVGLFDEVVLVPVDLVVHLPHHLDLQDAVVVDVDYLVSDC